MKKLKKKLNVIVHRGKDDFGAHVEDTGIFTAAKSIPELYRNLEEAANLYYEDQGNYVDSTNFNLKFDLSEFFRHYRVLNAKYLAERIGMNPTLLSQYVRGLKQPSDKQCRRIMEGVRLIGRELSGLRLG